MRAPCPHARKNAPAAALGPTRSARAPPEGPRSWRRGGGPGRAVEDVRAGTVDARMIVSIPPGLKRGANVRKAGEDVKAGESVLSAGAVLRPQDLSALASLGFGEVDCHQRLKVAIVSTGDEVVRAG